MVQTTRPSSAEILGRPGLRREEVVAALMNEVGLTHFAAERAYWATSPGYGVPSRLRWVTLHAIDVAVR